MKRTDPSGGFNDCAAGDGHGCQEPRRIEDQTRVIARQMSFYTIRSHAFHLPHGHLEYKILRLFLFLLLHLPYFPFSLPLLETIQFLQTPPQVPSSRPFLKTIPQDPSSRPFLIANRFALIAFYSHGCSWRVVFHP